MPYKWKMVFCVCVIMSVLTLGACNDNATSPQVVEINIDWAMTGTWMNRRGTDAVPTDVTIQGKIVDHEDSADALELSITLPPTFQYKVITPEPHFVSDNGSVNVLPHLFVAASYAYDSVQNCPIFCKFALDVEKEFFILVFDDTSYCLVAAQDPSVDAQTILNHFQDFLEFYCKEK